jgi:hypothetical protein
MPIRDLEPAAIPFKISGGDFMIADEFVEIERRRKELFSGPRTSPAEVSELDEKATQGEVWLCHCGEIALTECRCWG